MVDEAGRALYKAAHGPAAREFQAVMRYAVLTPQEQARAIQDIIRGGPDGTGAVRDVGPPPASPSEVAPPGDVLLSPGSY